MIYSSQCAFETFFQTVIYGMLFAFSVVVAQRFHIIDDVKNNSLFSKVVSLLVCILSVLGLCVSIRWENWFKN